MSEMPANLSLEAMVGRYLCFSLGKDRYAIPLLQVKEVIASIETTPIPHTPSYFKGILNLRGQVISVIDLRLKLNSPKPERSDETTIIILDLEPLLLGVVVDSVDCVVAYEKKDLSPRPGLDSTIKEDFLAGVARDEKSMTLILNMSVVLNTEDYQFLKNPSQRVAA